ncbi:MAG: hypothetical protein OXF02_02270 [Simkaniaceae bacterium]|nr:hypothetical protein [Simkaniaceae bacterium]
MSFFDCSKSSRSGSSPGIVEEQETKCAFLGEEVSERIMAVVRDSFGPDMRIVSIAAPAKGRAMVLYQRLQRDESKLPVRVVTPSPSPGGEPECVSGGDRPLVVLGGEKTSTEGQVSAKPKTRDVGDEIEMSDVNPTTRSRSLRSGH